jgi:hypothetical protein
MSHNVSKEQLLAPVKDQRDQPVLISLDVEDRAFADSIVADGHRACHTDFLEVRLLQQVCARRMSLL